MLALIFDEFGHLLGFHLGTPLASNSMFVGVRFVDDFSNLLLMRNGSENGPARCRRIQYFRVLFNIFSKIDFYMHFDRFLFPLGLPFASF